MKVGVLIFFIFALVVTVLNYPFKLKVAVHVNMLENLGFAMVKIFGCRLTNIKFELHNGRVGVKKNKKEGKKKFKQIRKFYLLCLLKNVVVKKGEVFFSFGIKEDAFKTAMVVGCVNSLVCSMFAVLINRNKGMKTFVSVEPCYKENKLEVSVLGVVSFSLIDVIKSINCAVLKYFKERRKQNV